MVDLKHLKEKNVSAEAWESKLGVPRESMGEKHQKLVDLIKDRIDDGRCRNLNRWRAFSAIDMAYDAAANQVAPTIYRDLVDKNLGREDFYGKLESYGLLPAGKKAEDLAKNKDGATQEFEFDEASFFKVLVPLVKAYVTIRVAKLFNDRNGYPLFKYTPRQFTAINRARAGFVEQAVGMVSANYGYRSTLRQAIHNCLMYAECLQFPMEPWHQQKSIWGGKEVIVKEGIRYVLPRPERTFIDLNYPPFTINTDTGCEFAGYWEVVRMKDLTSNEDFWQVDERVTPGHKVFGDPSFKQYLTEVYPCTAKIPRVKTSPSNTDRTFASEDATNDQDEGVMLTTLFMKIVPKDYDLGDYEHEVWCRFILADDEYIIWAEPMSYRPVNWWGYDTDGNRYPNVSMAMEVVPWQDHIGNIMSQILLSMKQNLANAIFFDQNIVDRSTLLSMKNRRGDQLKSLNFVPFDSTKNRKAQLSVKEAFHEFRFNQHNIAEMTNTISTVINVMERLLVMSSQEIGSAAAHQQSAREIALIAGSTSTRVQYTGSFIDDAIYAWQVQLYQAMTYHMESNYPGQVDPKNFPEQEAVMEALNISVPAGYGGGPIPVSITKESILPMQIEGFTERRDVANRLQEPNVATVMFQTLSAIASNPEMAQLVGPDRILEGFTMAAQVAGAPPDWKLEPSTSESGRTQQLIQQLQQVAEQIQQAATQQAVQAVGEQIAQPIAENTQDIQEIEQALQQFSQIIPQIVQRIQGLQGGQPAPQQVPPQAPQPAPIQ